MSAGKDLDRVTADARLHRAWELLQSPGITALSLDVFDTLLWRTVAEPAQAFALLGQRLLDRKWLPENVTPAGFAQLRVEAERRARTESLRQRGSTECRLSEIWNELRLVAVQAPIAEYEALEVEVEREVCRVDSAVAALATLAAERGKAVRLVSDTYLSADQLRRLLDRPELAGLEFSHVAVSSEYGVGKSEGLFDSSLVASGLDPTLVVHLGDNSVADVEGATAAGVLAVHYEKGDDDLLDQLRAEAVLDVPLGDIRATDLRDGDHGLTALRARAARLSEGQRRPDAERLAWRTGATVFGPSFTGFARWVHDRAAAHGAAKVLCLMREGEFLDALITQAADTVDHPIPSEPLWLSRQVCALASVSTGSRDELRKFLIRRKPSDVAGLLRQLGVDPTLLPQVQLLSGAPLDAPGVADAVVEALEVTPAARSALVARSRRIREQLYAHLDSQLPPEGPVVVVDLGWGGTIQALLSQLLEARGDRREVIGLYLVTQAVAGHRRLDGLILEGFLADAGEPAGQLQPVLRTPEILEQVCMADAGTLIGFHDDGTPRTADERMPRWQAAQRAAVQSGVFAFQALWASYAGTAPGALDLATHHARSQLLTQVSRIVTRPSPEEALLFGGWLHDDNFGDEEVGAIVDPASLNRARYLSPAGTAALTMREAYWPVGAACLVDPAIGAVNGLIAEGVLDATVATSPAECGDIAIYVDEGSDFASGPKDVVLPLAGPSGRVHVRSGQPVTRAERIRVDFTAQRGLIRLDSVTVRVSTTVRRDPFTLELSSGDLAGPAFYLHDARWAGAGLLEVTGDDPFWALDLRALCPPAVPKAHHVDVEIFFAYLALPGGPLTPVIETVETAAAPTSPTWERVARAAVRAARDR